LIERVAPGFFKTTCDWCGTCSRMTKHPAESEGWIADDKGSAVICVGCVHKVFESGAGAIMAGRDVLGLEGRQSFWYPGMVRPVDGEMPGRAALAEAQDAFDALEDL
jgi:hypothetical protein